MEQSTEILIDPLAALTEADAGLPPVQGDQTPEADQPAHDPVTGRPVQIEAFNYTQGPFPAPEPSPSEEVEPDELEPAAVDASLIGAPEAPKDLDEIRANLTATRLRAQSATLGGNQQAQLQGYETLAILDALDFLLRG